MQNITDRLSKLQAVQHYQLALIGAMTKICATHIDFKHHVQEGLLMHHAMLVGESRDEVKLSAFEELMEDILGKDPK